MISTLYQEISFPDLGISMNPSIGFELGRFSIRWYAVIIAFGLILAMFYGCKRCKRFGLMEDDIWDGVLWITPFAVICARLYYCVFKWKEFYAENPISMLYIWEGGLAIYGGVIGAAIGVLIFCRIKKIKPAALLDLVALGFLIGQSIGRWGNFINREAFGGPTDFFLRMGLTDHFGNTIYVHPTFLYESLWNAVGFVLLHFMSKRRKYDGQTALQYVLWYGVGRALIEGMRTDSLYIPGTSLRVSQVLSIAAAFCALVALIILHFRAHKPLFAEVVAEREAAKAAEAEAEAVAKAEEAEGDTASTTEAEGAVTSEEASPKTTETAEPSQPAQEKLSPWSRFDRWLRN